MRTHVKHQAQRSSAKRTNQSHDDQGTSRALIPPPLQLSATASLNAKQGVLQREGKEKGKDSSYEAFVPSISKSVGKGGDNDSADVKVIQRLLIAQGYSDVTMSGDCDETTIKAIRQFQIKTTKGKVKDGKVDVGKGTWKRLTKSYFQPDEVVRERKQFRKLRNLTVVPSNISKGAGFLRFVKDTDGTGKDDYMEKVQNAAEAAAKDSSRFDALPIKNLPHLQRVLQQYYNNQISVGTLIIASHGSYSQPGFVIGDDHFSASELSRLKPLHNLLAPSTKVIIHACHVGAGKNPEKGVAFSKDLANTLGVTTYTSRSWSVGSDNLYKGKRQNSAFHYKAEKSADAKKRPYVYEYMGQWLKTTPGKDETKSEVINSLKFQPDGSFKLSKERFPSWWKTEHMDQYKALRDIARKALKDK